MGNGWSGWLRSRRSATRKRVSCEYDDDGDWSGRGGGSGDSAGAGLFCAGGSSGRSSNGVRCGADGDVCAEFASGSVDGPGVVLRVCKEERNEGGDADDGRAGSGAEPGSNRGGGYGAARV